LKDRFHQFLGRGTAKKPGTTPQSAIEALVERPKKVDILIRNEKRPNLTGRQDFFVTCCDLGLQIRFTKTHVKKL
jgi:hypothetical protein